MAIRQNQFGRKFEAGALQYLLQNRNLDFEGSRNQAKMGRNLLNKHVSRKKWLSYKKISEKRRNSCILGEILSWKNPKREVPW